MDCGLRQTAAAEHVDIRSEAKRTTKQNITSPCLHSLRAPVSDIALSALKLSLTLSPLVEGGKNVKVERRCRPRGVLVYFCILKRCALNIEHNGQSVSRILDTVQQYVQFMSLHPNV